jgi:hypothetical protein
MKSLSAALLIVAMSTFIPVGTALADPGGPNLQEPHTYTCDGGLTLEINPGTATNFGRVGWAIDSSSVFRLTYFAVTDFTTFTFVFFDQAQGVTNLITCTSPVGPGDTFVAKGFITPR